MMINCNCPRCGRPFQVDDSQAAGQAVCPSCGQTVQPPVPLSAAATGSAQATPAGMAGVGAPAVSVAPPAKTSGWSLASLICGVVGCTGIGALLAIIFAILGFRDAKRGRRGKGLAVAGLLLGIFWILVSLILSVTVGLTAYHAAGATKMQYRKAVARSDITTLSIALEQFHLDQNRYPTADEGLEALIRRPAGVTSYPPGSYLGRPSLPKDPWGNDYHYVAPDYQSGKGYVIISYGSDGRPGGTGEAADISNRGGRDESD